MKKVVFDMLSDHASEVSDDAFKRRFGIAFK